MVKIFLIPTFSISWLVWIFTSSVWSDLVMFVPGATAIALTILTRKKLKILLRFSSIFNLLSGVSLSVTTLILYLLISYGFDLITFGLPQAAIDYNNGNVFKAWSRFLTFGIPYMFFVNSLFAFGEEIGWRGYLLSALNPVISSFWFRGVLVGIIWGAWHLPIYIIAEESIITILIFLFNVCLISICYTWLYERGNSIWPTVIAHGLHNTIFSHILPAITLANKSNFWWYEEEGLVVTICYALIILVGIIVCQIRSRKL